MSVASWFGTAFGLLVASVIVLAVFAPWAIPIVVNVFVFLLVDHIYGMIAGALVGAFLSPKITIAGIPVVGIAGTIVQYLLFH